MSSNKMRAIVFEKYGPPEVLQLKEVAKPTPGDGEVLIKVFATTAHAGDWRMRKPEPLAARLYNGLIRPKRITILGMELAGQIAAVGKGVTAYQEGDDVFAFAGFGFGAYAEYICLPARTEAGKVTKQGLVAPKPANLTYEQAAAVPAGSLTALNILRKGHVQSGQRVLIYGASGDLGTNAIQLAKYFGAEVTGVCSTANLGLVRSLGADKAIDYTQEDFTANGQTYHVIYDTVGKSPSGSKRSLTRRGAFLSSKTRVTIDTTDLAMIGGLLEEEILRPVIDRIYPLEEIVEAHRYVEQGHKRGNVAIDVKSVTHLSETSVD